MDLSQIPGFDPGNEGRVENQNIKPANERKEDNLRDVGSGLPNSTNSVGSSGATDSEKLKEYLQIPKHGPDAAKWYDTLGPQDKEQLTETYHKTFGPNLPEADMVPEQQK